MFCCMPREEVMRMKSDSKIWNYLCYAGLEKNEYLTIKKQIGENNLKMLLFGDAVFLFAMIISALINPVNKLLLFSHTSTGWLYSDELLYIGSGLCSLLLLLAALVGKHRQWPRMPLVYLYSLLLYLYAICMGMRDPSSQATTIMVFMVLLPTIFVVVPWKQLLACLLLEICFILLAWTYKTPAIAVTDSWNSIFFGIVGLISGFYFDRVMLFVQLEAAKTKFLSENDLLTGIKNRNYYQDRIEQLVRPATSTVTYVFCDVNGLHETNNTLGHEAGDRMLIALANELSRSFGRDLSFRFGGDEFLAVALDESAEEVRRKCDQLLENLEKQGYHISLGIARQGVDQLEINQLLFQADKAMRKAKEEYYKDTEYDRRAR